MARARQVVLVITALVFVAVAFGSLVSPKAMAEPFDYVLPSANAMSEFRAIYVGLWLAHAVVLLWAARRIDIVALGDVAGILVLGQTVGRVIAVALDGMPDGRITAPFIAEGLGGIVILALRPATDSLASFGTRDPPPNPPPATT